MFFVQIADLHIGSSKVPSVEEDTLIRYSVNVISDEVPKGNQICIIVNGDLIDSSDSPNLDEVKKRYQKAERLLSCYKNELENNYSVSYFFCIGNHDITHKAEYLDLVNKFDPSITEDEVSGIEKRVFSDEETVLLAVNTCSGDQYEKGKIDYNQLQSALDEVSQNDTIIIIMHHTLISMDEEDTANIRNAAKLIDILNTYNIEAIMHGHVHGRDIITIGKRPCKIIGVGALFSRDNADVNSQFNLAEIHKGMFKSIKNCRYSADGVDPDQKWNIQEMLSSPQNNYLSGRKWADVYTPLIKMISIRGVLYNLVLNLQTSRNEFYTDIETIFLDDYLSVSSEDKYTYIQAAKLWEATEVPEQLYFNHGAFFAQGRKPGIELVAEQLKEKATSSRAVLSTFNKDRIIQSYQDEKKVPFPSLLSIQFSKSQNGLIFVHMYLRALEVGRFLKINICEIYYLLKELEKSGIEFTDINITITAFRAQLRDNFSCFFKARIDHDNANVSYGISHKNYRLIYEVLQEKRDLDESIIHTKGIENMYELMKVVNKNEPGAYSLEIIEKTECLLALFKELDALYSRKSEQTEDEKRIKTDIKDTFNYIIDILRAKE